VFEIGDYPATCTTSSLSDGDHEIKVEFTDLMTSIYRDATLTLTQQVGILPDSTPPIITPTIDGTLGLNGWYTSDVNLTWTVTDAESTITSQSGCDPISITSDQAEVSYTCSATSAGGTTSVDVTIKRDATKPETVVTKVTDGAVYFWGRVPRAGCSTTDNLSGVASEAVLSLSGGNEIGLGTITATCSGALDFANNAADPVSVTYSVVQPADLKVNLTDNRDPIKPKSTLVYTMVVTNQGPYSASNVTLTDTLDPLTTLVSISKPKGWSCSLNSNVITCTTDKLKARSKNIFKVTVMVSKYAMPGMSLISTASVSSSTYDYFTANNSYTQKTRIGR
jgi:uncharacterized repeat protein (TIGR01451 family)